MPKWNGLTLTDCGKELQMKCQTGVQLVFTGIKLGDGVHAAGTSLEGLTDLKNTRQTIGITECKITDDHKCQISGIVSNAVLEGGGYYLRELGLFAQDPEAGEILYAITLDENPDFLPENGGSVTLSETFNILINIGNLTDVSAIIDIGGWATAGYVNQQITIHDTDPNAHYDMVGASLAADGKRGFVPQPKAGNPKRCLRADGTWGVPDDTTYTTMQGASTTSAGKSGLVPQPKAGDNMSYLRGDGAWAKPALQFYPVGSVYISVNNVSPATLFGGTWSQIKDRFLLAVGDNYKTVKQTGGEEKHTLTTNEMPAHNHGASSASAGGHTHTEVSNGAHAHTVSTAGSHTHNRGTMNITGAFSGVGQKYDGIPETVTGAFYVANTSNAPAQGVKVSNGGDRDDYFGFDASRSWTGTTSAAGEHSHTLGSNGAHTHTINSSGAHTHSITTNNTGGGAAHNNMPPYYTVYVWVRTA